MNDRAEQAFRDAFEEHSRVHFDPIEPRPQRPWGRWLVAAAVALVVLAVPVMLVVQNTGRGDGDNPTRGTAATPASSPDKPLPDPPPTLNGLPAPKDGWKWVSRYDVAVQVPEEWGYDDYAWVPWCLNEEPAMPESPFVSTPEGVIAAIGCPELEPQYVQMYLDWARPGLVPEVEHATARDIGEITVFVVLPQTADAKAWDLVDEILDTARRFERDFAGCAPVAPFSDFGDRPEPWDIATAQGEVEVGLCRYRDWYDDGLPTLTGSRLLAADESARLVEAIATAPEGLHSDDSCLPDGDAASGVVLRVRDESGIHDVYLRVDGCKDLGFDDGVTTRALIPDACQPVFSQPPLSFDAGSAHAYDNCGVPR